MVHSFWLVGWLLKLYVLETSKVIRMPQFLRRAHLYITVNVNYECYYCTQAGDGLSTPLLEDADDEVQRKEKTKRDECEMEGEYGEGICNVLTITGCQLGCALIGNESYSRFPKFPRFVIFSD